MTWYLVINYVIFVVSLASFQELHDMFYDMALLVDEQVSQSQLGGKED